MFLRSHAKKARTDSRNSGNTIGKMNEKNNSTNTTKEGETNKESGDSNLVERGGNSGNMEEEDIIFVEETISKTVATNTMENIGRNRKRRMEDDATTETRATKKACRQVSTKTPNYNMPMGIVEKLKRKDPKNDGKKTENGGAVERKGMESDGEDSIIFIEECERPSPPVVSSVTVSQPPPEPSTSNGIVRPIDCNPIIRPPPLTRFENVRLPWLDRFHPGPNRPVYFNSWQQHPALIRQIAFHWGVGVPPPLASLPLQPRLLLPPPPLPPPPLASLCVPHPVGPGDSEQKLRPIIIDGSNVAMKFGKARSFDCRGILLCARYFIKRGHRVMTFVPQIRRDSERQRRETVRGDLLEWMEKADLLTFTPHRSMTRDDRGRRCERYLTCYDDYFIVEYAHQTGGVIVSNDNFRDVVCKYPMWAHTVNHRLLMFSWVGQNFMPTRDPMGHRGGPLLEAYLLFHPDDPPVEVPTSQMTATERSNLVKRIDDLLHERYSKKGEETKGKSETSESCSSSESLRVNVDTKRKTSRTVAVVKTR